MYQATILINAFYHVNAVRDIMHREPNEDGRQDQAPDVIEIRVAVNEFAKRVLMSISEILAGFNIDDAASPNARVEMFQALIERRLLRFGSYHAVFLLLDCAIQLKRIVPGSNEALALERQAIEIATRRQQREATIRCKAVSSNAPAFQRG